MTDMMWKAVRALQGRSDIVLGSDLRAIVHAVLTAIREPDEAMVFNGAAVHDHPSVYMGGPSYAGKRLAARMFPKMIDAILAGDPS